MSGSIIWKAKAGWIEGITFRRPKISGEASTDTMLQVSTGCRLDIIQSVIDNRGSSGASAVEIEGDGTRGRWERVVIEGGNAQGVKVTSGAKLVLEKVSPTYGDRVLVSG